jgi:Family of unknown function (DUF6498)
MGARTTAVRRTFGVRNSAPVRALRELLRETSPITLLGVIGVNLIPLVGVLFLGWDLLSLLVLYWIESGIIGLFNVLKIRRIEQAQRSGQSQVSEPPTRKRALSAGTPVAPFFVLHYGLFWVVHGIFVLLIPTFAAEGGDLLPGLDYAGFSLPGVLLAAVGLGARHAASYWYEFLGRREYLRRSADAQMMAPYARLMVLHFTILFGGFVVAILGSPVGLLALMVLVKILAELLFQQLEARRAAPDDGPQPISSR